MWCLERNIHITPQHLPGTQNTIADAESWLQTDRTDWKLSPLIFHKIQKTFGSLEVDFMQLICLPSAHPTSAGGQIHLQKQQMHFSKCGPASRDIPIHHEF